MTQGELDARSNEWQSSLFLVRIRRFPLQIPLLISMLITVEGHRVLRHRREIFEESLVHSLPPKVPLPLVCLVIRSNIKVRSFSKVIWMTSKTFLAFKRAQYIKKHLLSTRPFISSVWVPILMFGKSTASLFGQSYRKGARNVKLEWKMDHC